MGIDGEGIVFLDVFEICVHINRALELMTATAKTETVFDFQW